MRGGSSSWAGAIGATVVAAVVAATAWSAAAGSAPLAQRPAVFTASIVLEDQRPLTVVDVATASVVARLADVYRAVGAASYADVQAVGAGGGGPGGGTGAGTWLVDRRSGRFNLLGADGYVVDSRGPGVSLGDLDGVTGAGGVAGDQGLFVVRSAAQTSVALIDRATVEAAAAGGTVGPVSTARLDGRADAPGAGAGPAAVVAGGSLWLLVTPTSPVTSGGSGAGGEACRVEQISAGAPPGSPLVVADRATLAGPCATASLAAIGPGAPVRGARDEAPVVAVAEPGAVTLLGARPRPPLAVGVATTARATGFVPATGIPGEAAWLVATPSGWSLLRVDRSGITVTRGVSGLAVAAQPAPPAWAGGGLYTLDRASAVPAVVRIDLAGATTTVHDYPLAQGETATFTAASAVAVGPRVMVNNPGSLLALVVATDGSRPPAVIDKRSALEVSASGPGVPDLGPPPGATPRPPSPAAPAPAGPVPLPAPLLPTAAAVPVDPQATCATTALRPYAPHISTVSPSSQGALVAWTYALLDEQDCVPATWSVRVTALGGAPQPAAALQRVEGQQQWQVTGLRPATTYQVVVTAYLPHASTPSAPVTFTTQPQGPDAPTSVQTVADGHGHWIVTWSACGGTACLVAADSWTITGTACGGSYAGTPPSVTVPAATSSTQIDAAGVGLLGTSLSFRVAGSTAGGLRGPATADGTCTEAWQPPDPGALDLAGAATASGSTLTVTLALASTGDPAVAFGGSDPQIVYSVGGRTVGPTAAASVTVAGLVPGVAYTPVARVWSARHPEAAITLTGAPFTQTLPWPHLTLSATGGPTTSDPNVGRLVATVGGLAPGTYSAAGTLTCGQQRQQVDGPLDPSAAGATLTVAGIDLTAVGGACTVTLSVTDTDAPDPYGVASPPVRASLQLGSRPSYRFTATYSGTCATAPGPATGSTTVCSEVVVSFDGAGGAGGGGGGGGGGSAGGSGGGGGGGTPSQPSQGGIDWTVTAAGTSRACNALPGSTATSSAPDFPVTVVAPVCPKAADVDVTVSFRYLGATVPVIDLGAPRGTTGSTTTTTTPGGTTTTVAPTTTPTVPPTTAATTTTTTTTGPPPSSAPPTTAAAPSTTATKPAGSP